MWSRFSLGEGCTVASAGPKWQCLICQKTLAGKPLNGLAGKHSGSDGQLCSGSGRPAFNASKRPKQGSSAKPKRTSQRQPQGPEHRRPKGGANAPNNPRAVVVRERPEVLPPPGKRPKSGKEVFKNPKNMIAGELHWSTFGDMPRQDLQTDAGWRRVRLGAPQGSGKRR